jgi:glutamate synthase (NADPH/NADH) large chain
MSKMGISTVASYTGAQVFEAVGLDHELIERYFTGTSSTIGGIGLTEIAAEVARRHATAYPANAGERAHRRLEVGGEYQWRREGELHLYNPETVFLLQHATRTPGPCAGCSRSAPRAVRPSRSRRSSRPPRS